MLLKFNTQIGVNCFFEERSMRIIGIIMPENSAALFQYPKQIIAADHRDMTKFSGKNDSGYQEVLGRVKKFMWATFPTHIVVILTKHPDYEKRVKCHQLLRTSDYERYKDRNPEPVTGTFLFCQRPQLLEHVLSSYDQNGDKLINNANLLRDLLVVASADPDAGEVICILDALDGFKRNLRLDTISILRAELRKVEHRTYLWLALVINEIYSSMQAITKKGREKTFGTIPKSVDDAYTAILNRSEDLEIYSEEFSRRFIRHLCGFFVSIIDGRLYLPHQTAKEFLIAQDIPAQKPYQCHEVESELRQLNSEYGFLEYAAENWAVHFRKASISAGNLAILNVATNILGRNERHPSRAGNPRPPLCIRSGIVGIIDHLLTSPGSNVNLPDENGGTPLYIAAYRGHEALVPYLIGAPRIGVNRTNDMDQTPLFIAFMKKRDVIVQEMKVASDIDLSLLSGPSFYRPAFFRQHPMSVAYNKP
ncbi:hypothetical protein B0J14DRAFT_632218 [Halenospora varia]|nr:hypothetical protein B0J14DRAFT_632218 [Halenospora varia]